jgi:hypothetical protein
MAFNLFGNAVPATVNANDGPLALGTVVQISSAGTITHGRWRFPTSLPGGPVTWYCADLSTHTLLGSQVFTAPVAGQWVQQALAVPIAITGPRNVLVWIGTPGGYVFTNGLFTAAPTVSGPLTAPRSINDPEGVGNGRFGSTPSSYPGGTSGATSYFADLVFELAPPNVGSATLGLELLLHGVGETPVPPPPSDPIGTPVANQLLACLTDQLATLPNPPANIQLRVGQDTGPLIGPNIDECCAGLAWVRIAGIYPSWDSFPAADNTWLPCGPLAYAVVLEMGVAFCMPWSDSEESFDNLDPPSQADWATAFNTQMVHQTLMRRAAACCFLPTQRRAVGEWTPLPVEGGCTGGKMTVTVSVMAPCADC